LGEKVFIAQFGLHGKLPIYNQNTYQSSNIGMKFAHIGIILD